MELHPTLWRTCRIIANETRLVLLWHLFNEGELTVTQLMERAGIAEPIASNQLRALSARGLISCRRRKTHVLYRAEANDAVRHAPLLLSALDECHQQAMPFKHVIWQATAFTHERRIEIVRTLNAGPLTLGALGFATGISCPALSRHLKKLQARGFIRLKSSSYLIVRPGNPLGRVLIGIASTRSAPRSATCAAGLPVPW
jgi:DNA-binding transcriptional ArsR family regulator